MQDDRYIHVNFAENISQLLKILGSWSATVIYWVTTIYRSIIYTGPLTVQSTPDKSKVGVDRRLKQITTSLACSTFLQKYEPYIQFHGSLRTDIVIFQLLLLSEERNCICKLPLHTQSKRRRQTVRVFVAITSFPSKSFFFFSLSISSLSDVFALSNWSTLRAKWTL